MLPSTTAHSEGGKRKSVRALARESKRGKGRTAQATPAGSSSRIKVIKKPRDPDTVEADISALEKRLSELSVEMSKPEVARDISRLVELNDEYHQGEARLAELLDEWERAEAPSSLKR
jgi:hypothetical protein